ncbi:MAG: outer membrane lipoprotein carrier protein LolA [Beggiatoa sp. IS2]|nr:MAG: outer membrane lipoprotein carrier protein LolA [Beggiatoa sp. IS2]
MKLYWLFLLIFWLVTPAWAAEENLDDFLNSLKTFYAEFEQKQFGEGSNLLETAHGEVYIQRPGRWDYQQPYDQLIIADGKKVWIYDHDLEQVTVKQINDALGKTPALLLSSDSKVADNFMVTTSHPQENVTRFTLKPKDSQAQFDSLRINLQSNSLQSLELVDNLGQTTSITFKKINLNQVFKPELFVFKPPAGIDIIESTESSPSTKVKPPQ